MAPASSRHADRWTRRAASHHHRRCDHRWTRGGGRRMCEQRSVERDRVRARGRVGGRSGGPRRGDRSRRRRPGGVSQRRPNGAGSPARHRRPGVGASHRAGSVLGAEASAELARLLPPSTEVRIERDHQLRDRYDRLLLYIYRASDDLFINDWLVRNGLADTSFYEPNLTRSVSLTQSRAEARSGGDGLWSRCDGPDQPLD